jgi:RsmE family RNA methyltransferase
LNLILLADEDFDAGTSTVRLHGRRLQYVRTVHRAQVGERLRVGVVDGAVGSGLITALGDDELAMAVTLDAAPPPPLPVTLLLALPRPKALKRLLQGVTAMGVKRIVLVNSWRVEKSFWDSPLLDPIALREQLLLGLEQGRDTMLPEVMLRRRFKPFVEDEVPALAQGTRPLVAHPVAAAACPFALRARVTLAVGPEGGFIPYEIDMLRAHGFEPVSLGPRPLRVEQAVPALLGRLF